MLCCSCMRVAGTCSVAAPVPQCPGACPRCFMVAKLHPCPLLPAGAAPAAPSCSILALRSTREGNSRLLRTNCPSSLTSRFTFTRNASKRCPLPCGTGTAPPLAAGQSGRHREQPSAEFQTMPAEFQTMPTPSRDSAAPACPCYKQRQNAVCISKRLCIVKYSLCVRAGENSDGY